MKDQRVDLFVLDPSRDEERWGKLVESVASRAWEARRKRLTIGFQLVAWARPSLAIAAATALTIWAGALTRAETNASASRSQGEPVFLLAGWAMNDELPDTTKILSVLGGRNDAN